MFYKVLYSKKALKSLKKMDNHNKLYILSWITKNLEGTDNPYEKGKTLKGNFKGSVRYKIGEYRVIVDVRDNGLIILVIDIDHRKNIYL